jgi:hypothetical protein
VRPGNYGRLVNTLRARLVIFLPHGEVHSWSSGEGRLLDSIRPTIGGQFQKARSRAVNRVAHARDHHPDDCSGKPGAML